MFQYEDARPEKVDFTITHAEKPTSKEPNVRALGFMTQLNPRIAWHNKVLKNYEDLKFKFIEALLK